MVKGESNLDQFHHIDLTRDGSYMFNTGDLGKWNADGTIEILGRADDQVKIKVSPIQALAYSPLTTCMAPGLPS